MGLGFGGEAGAVGAGDVAAGGFEGDDAADEVDERIAHGEGEGRPGEGGGEEGEGVVRAARRRRGG